MLSQLQVVGRGGGRFKEMAEEGTTRQRDGEIRDGPRSFGFQLSRELDARTRWT